MTLSKLFRGLISVVTEVFKIGREMLVIPAQLWLLAAEIAGAAVLAVWRRALLPVLLAASAALARSYALAERHVTPAHAVGAVALAAAIALAASQWSDYRAVSVGTETYGGVESVAPAPDVARDRAGDAHGWVMLPLAAVAAVITVLALRGRRQLARLLIAVGLAVVVVGVAVDAPKGLDEGGAALAYEGAEAHLLEGFWAQLASGAVLIACGALLPAAIGGVLAGEPAGGVRRRRATGSSRRTARSLPRPRLPQLPGREPTLQDRFRSDPEAERTEDPGRTNLSGGREGSSA